MKNTRIHLQGMDLRTPDAEAGAGVVRMMRNMYPTGEVDKPIWKTAAAEKNYYSQHAGIIIDGYAWFRANQEPQLVYLVNQQNIVNKLNMVAIDGYGNIIPSRIPVTLWNFNDLSNARAARFAQVGDTLVVCVTRNDEPEELLVVSNGENNTTICLPYNLPELPVIIADDDAVTGAIERDIRENSDGTARTRSEGLLGNSEADQSYFGFRFGFELNDGSVVRLSNVILRSSAKRGRTKQVRVRTTESGVVQSKKRADGPSRDPYPQPVTQQEEFESTDYFGKGWKVSANITAVLPNSYKRVIKGIAVFASEPKSSYEAVLSDAVYYRVGLISGLFDGAGLKSLPILINDVELPTFLLLEEDNLMVHNILASEVFSYNRNLLFAGATYNFVRPWNGDNTKVPDDGGKIYRVPLNFDCINSDNYVYVFTWNNNYALLANFAESEIIGRVIFEGKSSDWVLVYNGVDETFTDHTFEFRTYERIEYKIRHLYKNGQFSDWVGPFALSVVPRLFPQPLNFTVGYTKEETFVTLAWGNNPLSMDILLGSTIEKRYGTLANEWGDWMFVSEVELVEGYVDNGAYDAYKLLEYRIRHRYEFDRISDWVVAR